MAGAARNRRYPPLLLTFSTIKHATFKDSPACCVVAPSTHRRVCGRRLWGGRRLYQRDDLRRRTCVRLSGMAGVLCVWPPLFLSAVSLRAVSEAIFRRPAI